MTTQTHTHTHVHCVMRINKVDINKIAINLRDSDLICIHFHVIFASTLKLVLFNCWVSWRMCFIWKAHPIIIGVVVSQRINRCRIEKSSSEDRFRWKMIRLIADPVATNPSAPWTAPESNHTRSAGVKVAILCLIKRSLSCAVGIYLAWCSWDSP